MSLSRALGAPGRAADSLVAGLADLDPRAAQAVGLPTDRLWADPGPDAVETRADLARTALADLHATGVQTGPAEVLRRALTERLTSDLELHDSGFTPGLVAPLASPAHAVLSGLESAVREPDRLLEGLAEVPAALGAYAERLEAAAAHGYVAPARQSRTLAAQLLRWADPAADDRLGRLLTRTGAPEGSAPHTRLERAREACRDLASWLLTAHAPRGSATDAVGAGLYRTTAGAFLGTEVDLDETYAYGWELLDELTARAEGLALALGCSGLAEAEALLDARPEGLVPVGPELVAWVEERTARAARTLDGVVLDVPAAIPLEAVLAAPGSGSIYYSPPDPAGTRPGRVVWSTPTGAQRVPVWREVSTVLHEGVPGHHLQHAVTAATTTLHPWQRHLCHVHGHAEGWAHYVEGRAGAWGLLEDPAEQLGTVLAQRWRAARIVVDMGLHLDLPVPANPFTQATRWEPGVGVEVLTQAAGCDEETARFEVVRYLGWPGQALAFALGARLWEDAREAALTRGLDEHAFHAQALSLGPMGMAPLRATLAEAARA
ncbi:DUF885 domain-containing protein [Ornithinimicrobium avium]|uniref:DUF885 domain-containing protein n=1 Tax=Ornithinimicrobium avium TaxID=2283195 RepID=A0A345NL44_9MICO|nr:DUF885 domain-containing protein [Ornithinimicrobium avium]AXH95752.1 DUF885 domain-containing protein [Ornithinimicrobium avium]